MTDDDILHLDRAIALARIHMEQGEGGPFGAVIAREGKVLAEGWNCVTSTNDPTAHAEVVAIRRACETVGQFSLEGAVMYASCEPCPMCLAASYWARVSRIVYGATRKEAAAAGFDDSLIYDEIPLDPPQRSLPMLHLPSLPAKTVFYDWLTKSDRQPY